MDADAVPPRTAWITGLGWIHCLIGFAAGVSPLVALENFGSISGPPIPIFVIAVGGGFVEAAGVLILLRRRSALWVAPIGGMLMLAGLTWLFFPELSEGDWLESPAVEWLAAVSYFTITHFVLRAREKEFVADRLLDEEAPE
ncbi:MAG TPA: hypothetical protein VI643_06980 [Planctomycetota bacterium]|nr:hypothetical protein [Planctomycetota bacterium]